MGDCFLFLLIRIRIRVRIKIRIMKIYLNFFAINYTRNFIIKLFFPARDSELKFPIIY